MARRTTSVELPELDLDRLRSHMDHQAKIWGANVRRRRIELSWTQLQLATLVGVPSQTISKVERGDIAPRGYLMAALSLRLALEPGVLFPLPSRSELIRSAV